MNKGLNIKPLIFVILLFSLAMTMHPSNTTNHIEQNQHIQGIDFGGIVSGFIIGPIFLIITFYFIWNNERKAAIDYRRFKLADQISVQCVEQDEQKKAQKNNKLINANGVTRAHEHIEDTQSGILVTNSIKLIRKVQVRQWRSSERQQQPDVYYLHWASVNHQTVGQKANDPKNWLLKDKTIFAKKVTIGQQCQLTEEQKKKCEKRQKIHPNMNNAQKLQNHYNISRTPIIDDHYIFFPAEQNGDIHSHGAVRISYYNCPAGPITIMAVLKENSFAPFDLQSYEEKDIACCSPPIFLPKKYNEIAFEPIKQINFIKQQQINKEQLIKLHCRNTNYYSRIVRIICFVVLFIGLLLVFFTVSEIGGSAPIVGNILEWPLFLKLCLGALIAAIPIFIIVIAIVWLCFYKKVGIWLLLTGLLLATGILVLFYFLNKSSISQTTKKISHFMLRH